MGVAADDSGRPASGGGLVRLLARWGTGSRAALLFVFLASLALAVAGLAAPILTGAFIDLCLARGLADWVVPLLAGLALTAPMRAGLFWLQQHVLLRLENDLARRASFRFFERIVRLPATFFLEPVAETGRLPSRAEIGSRVQLNDRIARLVARDLVGTLLNVLTAALYLALMLWIDALLALIALAMAAANFIVLWGVARWRRERYREVLENRGDLVATSSAGLLAIETIKATGSEPDFFGRWAGALARGLKVGQGVDVSSQLLGTVPVLLSGLSVIVVLGVGAVQVMGSAGALTIGMLVAFQSLMAGFLGPIEQLAWFGRSLQEVEGELRRLEEVTAAPPDAEASAAPDFESWTRAERPVRLAGELRMSKVTFGYPGKPPLLEDFSLEIGPGKRVALVGASGSGKSTVAKLVCGVYRPEQGQVELDGFARAEIPRAVLARSLAFVDQDIFLFAGTVRDVLTLWDATIPEADVIRAAKDASIHREIAARPGAYGSPVEEGGANFSGGQRQRLEIARALAGNPSFLVLDEATSALDDATEARIDENLRRRGCTCLIVAHRLSTVRDCDEIIVLKLGKIAEKDGTPERGAHDFLMGLKGEYYRLIHAGAERESP